MDFSFLANGYVFMKLFCKIMSCKLHILDSVTDLFCSQYAHIDLASTEHPASYSLRTETFFSGWKEMEA